MASKTIVIRCIGEEPFLSQSEKLVYSIILQTIFHEYENPKIKTSFVSLGLRLIIVDQPLVVWKVIGLNLGLTPHHN